MLLVFWVVREITRNHIIANHKKYLEVKYKSDKENAQRERQILREELEKAVLNDDDLKILELREQL